MSQSNDAGRSAMNPHTSDSLEQYYREKLENVRKHLPALSQQLQAAGVAAVRILYDGCGDSGQIESIEYLDAEGQIVNAAMTVAMPAEQLADLMYDLVQARHPGWENEDGAFGDIDWDLATDSLRHVHNDRFTDYSTTEHAGL